MTRIAKYRSDIQTAYENLVSGKVQTGDEKNKYDELVELCQELGRRRADYHAKKWGLKARDPRREWLKSEALYFAWFAIKHLVEKNSQVRNLPGYLDKTLNIQLPKFLGRRTSSPKHQDRLVLGNRSDVFEVLKPADPGICAACNEPATDVYRSPINSKVIVCKGCYEICRVNQCRDSAVARDESHWTDMDTVCAVLAEYRCATLPPLVAMNDLLCGLFYTSDFETMKKTIHAMLLFCCNDEEEVSVVNAIVNQENPDSRAINWSKIGEELNMDRKKVSQIGKRVFAECRGMPWNSRLWGSALRLPTGPDNDDKPSPLTNLVKSAETAAQVTASEALSL